MKIVFFLPLSIPPHSFSCPSLIPPPSLFMLPPSPPPSFLPYPHHAYWFERGGGRGRERERNMMWETNTIGYLWQGPDWGWNPQPGCVPWPWQGIKNLLPFGLWEDAPTNWATLARANFTSSFLIWMAFISFSYLIVLIRTSNSMLNKSGKSRHFCLFADLRGKVFSLLSVSMVLALGFSYMAFIVLRKFSSIPSFFGVFIMKACWILSNAFSASVEMIMFYFFFILLIQIQLSLGVRGGLVPGQSPTSHPTVDTQIHGCSCPLYYQMAENSANIWPLASWISERRLKNTIFYLWLIESVDTELVDVEGWLYPLYLVLFLFLFWWLC